MIIKQLIGVLAIIIGVFLIVIPFFPPQSICDLIVDRSGDIMIIIAGVIVTLSGMFNVFRT